MRLTTPKHDGRPPGVTIADEVTNLSAQPGELELLYHTNFGLPLVARGEGRAAGQAARAARRGGGDRRADSGTFTGPRRPARPEVCHFFELAADAAGNTLAVLRSGDGSQGVSVKFNNRQLPCFTVWKNRQGAIDGYVTGLEPATNYPNPKSFEKAHGRVVAMAPGETRRFQIAIEAHADAAAVAAAEKAVAAIQANVKPEICDKPDPDWAQ